MLHLSALLCFLTSLVMMMMMMMMFLSVQGQVPALPPQEVVPTWVAGAFCAGSFQPIPPIAWGTLAHFSLDVV